MRVICSPDSFRGSASAVEAARAMALGVRDAGGRAVEVPLSDGGEGLLQVLAALYPGVAMHRVTGVDGGEVEVPVRWTADRRCALIESRLACGLGPGTRPTQATTRGVGELIAGCLDAREIVVGLGGSGTCDGGLGMAGALGVRFFDQAGRELPAEAASMARVAGVDRSARVPLPRLRFWCDVDVRLSGARAFLRQKGADAAEEEALVRGLEALAGRFGEHDGVGGGAAGGLGFGGVAWLGGTREAGARAVLEALGSDLDADLVLTGEGAFDRTSLRGKVVGEVLRRARCPVVVLAGRVEEGLEGIELAGGRSFEEARGTVLADLRREAERVTAAHRLTLAAGD